MTFNEEGLRNGRFKGWLARDVPFQLQRLSVKPVPEVLICSSKVNPQHKYTRQKFTENYRIISDTTSTLRDTLRVMSHFSVRLCIGLNDLLKVVFPDSEIAKGFELSKTKCSYLINFGVSSYFKIELVNCIKVSTSFVSLDDSLNQIKQNEQMYTQICFWNEPTMMVERRYLIQRPNLKTLLLI